MKFQDLYSLIEEESKYGNILVPRRTEGRIDRFIQEYIKNGSKGDLDLRDVNITKLPDNLKKVGGYLDLSYSLISEIPDNLNIDGDLVLVGVKKLFNLPDNLSVVRDLNLTDTRISKLPNNLSVGENIHVYWTPLSRNYTEEEIRNMVKHVGGKIINY